MNRNTAYPPKIVCPNTTTIVHRPRLFNALDKARQQAKLIWIAAPGGSGKTTLVSSYLKKKQISHCWYQVDEDDRDLATFFHYLGLAGKLAAPRRKKAAPKLTPEFQQGISAFTRHFFKDISSRLKNDGLIVLDNYQLLSESGSVPNLLPTILESLSDGISLLIISRHLPPQSTNVIAAKRQLSVIDADQIHFSENEWLSASQLFNSSHSREKLVSLHRKLDGWIAGLVLLPATSSPFDNTNTSGLGIDLLDTYIAEQFLSSLNSATNKLLIKLCYMPHITIKAAKFVSGISHSDKLLAELARKNLFVLRQGEKGFTLHPLVREYLKLHAKTSLSKQQLYDLRLATATALLAEDECEAAADLLLELEVWRQLIAVILKYAEGLYDAGRIESLQRYINAVPLEISRDEPWISYWRGKITVYTDVKKALDYYDRAYARFIQKNDVVGIYLTWCAAVSVICTALTGGNRLTTWISRYNEFTIQHPQPPTLLQKGFVEAILLQAYFVSGQNPAKRESLRVRLSKTMYEETDPLMNLHMMSNYMHVTILSGIKAQDKIIADEFENNLSKIKDHPVLYLGALTCCSLNTWAFNDFNKLLSLEKRALEVSVESGVSVFNSHIYTKIVVAALELNKYDLAKQYLNIMDKERNKDNNIDQSLYFTCLIAAGTNTNDSTELDKMAEYYLDILEKTYIPAFILNTKLLYIYYLCLKGRTESALLHHSDLHLQTKKLAFPGQSSRFLMIYAKIFFDNNEFARCDDYLKKSFTIAKQHELLTYSFWHPDLMVWACHRALTLDIETIYVKQFIESHYKNLPQPDSKYQRWPWPLRVHTFGGFELKIKNDTLQQRKQTGKSFTLLKTLIKAHDGYLTSNSIKEMLYTDENYEKASQLLDTQIHRLRKMLGDEQTILRQGDRIALNPKYFWIDTSEFETLGKQKITASNAQQIAIRLQELYKGEYLPDDESIDVIAHRERFRNIYLATLFKCIDHLEITSSLAIEFCQIGLLREPLSEPLYRKLISIYLQQKNRDMAHATLEQCRKLVKHHFNGEVSNETLALLKSGNQSAHLCAD